MAERKPPHSPVSYWTKMLRFFSRKPKQTSLFCIAACAQTGFKFPHVFSQPFDYAFAGFASDMDAFARRFAERPGDAAFLRLNYTYMWTPYSPPSDMYGKDHALNRYTGRSGMTIYEARVEEFPERMPGPTTGFYGAVFLDGENAADVFALLKPHDFEAKPLIVLAVEADAFEMPEGRRVAAFDPSDPDLKDALMRFVAGEVMVRVYPARTEPGPKVTLLPG